MTGNPGPLTEAPELTQLNHIYHQMVQLELLELAAINQARQVGVPWRLIAPTLGLGSPQAAQYRQRALARRHRHRHRTDPN